MVVVFKKVLESEAGVDKILWLHVNTQANKHKHAYTDKLVYLSHTFILSVFPPVYFG